MPAGCVSLDTAVPPVSTLPVRGKNAAILEAGRRVYLEKCTNCHSPQPVREYTALRWPHIISDMEERAKLSADQQRTLLAYVLAATAK
jgi:cbb3-type cytochrome oxidase cytochrome c subunit